MRPNPDSQVHQQVSLPRGKRRAVTIALSRLQRRCARPGVNDRGTVLLMVLGVLALMAIIAIVYASLGKADRAASTSIVRNTRLDDQAGQIADYLSGVIRDGLFATYVDPDLSGNNPKGNVRWRGWDYPFTDPYMRSQPNNPNGPLGINEYRFTPTGSYSTPAVGNNPDRRTPGVPFLSASEPDNLRLGAPGYTPTDPTKPYLDKVDWLSISNFAPSGNFVNLVNLRNNFKCPSGFSPNPGGQPYMSDQKSLLTASGQPTLRLADGRTQAEPRRPADWTIDQQSAFRLMADNLPPEDPNHIFNQYCDTDGDGYADSRWFELVDVWNQNDPRPVIPNNGRARLFVAARCVDLSGRVNVNTAGDLYRFPEQAKIAGYNPITRESGSDYVQFVPGLFPSDVDLLRVLRRTDAVLSLQQCYDVCPQPTGTNAVGDYSSFGPQPSMLGGLAAYQAIWDFRDAGRVNPALGGELLNRVPAPDADYPLWTDPPPALPSQGNPMTTGFVPAPSAWDRFNFYAHFGDNVDNINLRRTPKPMDAASYQAYQSATNFGSREVVSAFDNADLLELLTFEGVNDSSKQSRLEATTTGRSYLPHTPSMRDYDPLRSTRPTTIEKLGRNSGDTPANLFDKALLQREIDVRHLLTTLSGDRPLRSSPLPGGSDPVDMRANVRTDVTGMIASLASGADPLAVQNFFRIYANALMPYTHSALFPDAWDFANNPRARGLSYGGRAELAYLIAAHMALNLSESLDRQATNPADQAPAPYTVDLTRQAVNQTLAGGTQRYTADYPWPRLTLTDDPLDTFNLQRMTNDSAQIKSVQSARATAGEVRKTLFGIAPQPFLTQVMAINCFVDAPPNAGGDDDVSRNYDPNTNEPLDPITINFGQELSNSDFLFSVLAFQVTNPFDVDVQLEDAGQINNDSFYYFEYAGRSYRLRAQDTSGTAGLKSTLGPNDCPRLKPHETRVFYATFPASEEEVNNRVRRVQRGLERRLGAAASDFKLADFARHQFGDPVAAGAAGTRDPVHIATIYPETGQAVRNNTALTNPDLHATNAQYEVQSPDGVIPAQPALLQGRAERRVVNLWRVMRQTNTASADQDGPGMPNKRGNDMLVDRLHDPSDRTTYQDGVLVKSLVDPFGGGNLNQEITGTHAGDDSSSSNAHDNTGFAFACFASISRATNPRNASRQYPKVALGQMPIWCFETKTDNEIRPNGAPAFTLNKETTADTRHTAAAFNSRNHYKELHKMIDDIVGANMGTVRIDDDMQKKVENKVKNPYNDVTLEKTRIDLIKAAYSNSTDWTDRSFNSIRYGQVAPVLYRVAGKVKDTDVTGIGTFKLNGAVNTTTPEYEYNSRTLYSRVGDFLLPLVVGPSYDPVALGDDVTAPDILPSVNQGAGSTAPENRIKNLEAQWTTLSEALALATDYYTPRDAANPYYRFARDTRVYAPTTTSPELPKSDHGCLTLDAWAPYIDGNSNGQFDPTNDQPLGNGVPLALNILDSIRVGGMPAMAGRPAFFELGLAAPGGFNSLIPGRINANTAPVSVLRALPLLSPDLAASQDPTSNNANNLAQSWQLNQSGLNPTNAADAEKLLARAYNATNFDFSKPERLWDPNKPLQNWDIAATMVAYRDKKAEQVRTTGSGPNQAPIVNFREDRNVPGGPRRPGGGAPWGRLSATGIQGLHEGRGFRTPGEVLAVNIQHSTDAAVRAATGGPDRDNSIMRLGEDGLATYSASFDAAVATDPATGRTGPNQVPDDYAEKLTIANAILNTITVRTDIFAVWFVINGYTPEDVQVEDGFPMVPSIARRYVMVVDRSNVTQPNQKPRIVMLKEVPLR